MEILLAIALVSAPGCHSAGSKVHCDLAPPVPQIVSQPKPVSQARPTTPRLVRATAHPSKRPTTIATDKPADPTPEEIDRHIATLVAIQDCTGARAFARTVGAEDLGERTYNSCIGIGSPIAPSGVASR